MFLVLIEMQVKRRRRTNACCFGYVCENEERVEDGVEGKG
jgi:hypothetical protein